MFGPIGRRVFVLSIRRLTIGPNLMMSAVRLYAASKPNSFPDSFHWAWIRSSKQSIRHHRALSSIKLVQENEERLMKETESTSFFLVITLSSIVFFSFGLRLMIEQVMTWLAAVSSLIGDRDSQPGLTSGYKRFPLPFLRFVIFKKWERGNLILEIGRAHV